MLSAILVAPQITAGMSWYFLRRSREGKAPFDAMFEGFSLKFVKLLLVGLVQVAAMLIFFGVMVGLLAATGVSFTELANVQNGGPPPAVGAGFFVVFFVSMLLAMFLGLRFSLVHIIAMDGDMGVIDSYRLSWRIVGMRFWTLLGMAIILALLGIAGALALLIGLLFVAPLVPCVIAQAYEDARMLAAGNPPRN